MLITNVCDICTFTRLELHVMHYIRLMNFQICFRKHIDALRRYGVPVGGDQLTRVRLQEAKNIRSLAVTPERRYDDLHPIVCEMWHSKQDFLEVN